jgi:hypothetical protein
MGNYYGYSGMGLLGLGSVCASAELGLVEDGPMTCGYRGLVEESV